MAQLHGSLSKWTEDDVRQELREIREKAGSTSTTMEEWDSMWESLGLMLICLPHDSELVEHIQTYINVEFGIRHRYAIQKMMQK
ncbi:hypothetical protein [Cronobacter phage vB_Cdu_VP8]|nr:hypothetical protein [Cronobacter phage vB_Cdu_VP8]